MKRIFHRLRGQLIKDTAPNRSLRIYIELFCLLFFERSCCPVLSFDWKFPVRSSIFRVNRMIRFLRMIQRMGIIPSFYFSLIWIIIWFWRWRIFVVLLYPIVSWPCIVLSCFCCQYWLQHCRCCISHIYCIYAFEIIFPESDIFNLTTWSLNHSLLMSFLSEIHPM